MRYLTGLTTAAACTMVLAGCATTDGYASACERDYAQNRERATAAGALLGAAVGAAVAGMVGDISAANDQGGGRGPAGTGTVGRGGSVRLWLRRLQPRRPLRPRAHLLARRRPALVIIGRRAAQAQQLAPVIGHHHQGLTAFGVGFGDGLLDEVREFPAAVLGSD